MIRSSSIELELEPTWYTHLAQLRRWLGEGHISYEDHESWVAYHISRDYLAEDENMLDAGSS